MDEKQFAISITLLTAFAYYMGWAYLYHYYYFLGIDVFEINPSLQYTLIYSLPGLLHLISPRGELAIFLFSAVVISAILMIIFYKTTPANQPKRKKQLIHAAYVLLVALLLIEGFRSAKSLARADAISKWTGDSNPAFLHLESAEAGKKPCPDQADAPNETFGKQLQCLNSQLKLRLVISTQQFHYLFAPSETCGNSEGKLCGGMLFKIPTSDSTVTILQPGEASHE